jgi:hypothetical protein
VLRQEDVRRSRGAQDDVDEVGGGPAWASIVEALGGGSTASVAPFGATASTTRWGWPRLEGGGGTRGAAARELMAHRHGPVDGGTIRQTAPRLSSREGERRGERGVKKSAFASEPRSTEDKGTRGGARGRPWWSSSRRRVAEQLALLTTCKAPL